MNDYSLSQSILFVLGWCLTYGNCYPAILSMISKNLLLIKIISSKHSIFIV